MNKIQQNVTSYSKSVLQKQALLRKNGPGVALNTGCGSPVALHTSSDKIDLQAESRLGRRCVKHLLATESAHTRDFKWKKKINADLEVRVSKNKPVPTVFHPLSA